MGNALNGWTVDVQQEESQGYRWGYVYGSYNGCAWVPSAGLGDTPTTSDDNIADLCAHEGREVSGFTNGEVDGNNDGASRHLASGCDGTRFYNKGGADPTGTGYGPGQQILFRYTTPDGAWAMVRDPNQGDGDGWSFVHRECVGP